MSKKGEIMEERKSYKIGLLPMLLLIIDIVLIVVVIFMGIIIYTQKQFIKERENIATSNPEVVQTIPQKEETEPVKEDTNTTTVKNEVVNEVVNEIKNEVKNEVSNSVSNTTETNNTTDPNPNSGEEYTPKMVENRSYIYDAQYTPNGVKVSNYTTTSDGKDHFLSEIVVPYINMMSDDASKMNTEIEELYKGYIEEFKVCSQNLNSFIKVSYTSYITSNVYSIVITVERGVEKEVTNEYIAYNFDIISGTKLAYNQVCFIAKITNAGESVKEAINQLSDLKKYVLTVSRDVSQESVNKRNEELDECKNQIYAAYEEDVLNNSLVYYLDNNLKLNISAKIVVPGNENSYNKLIRVDN